MKKRKIFVFGSNTAGRHGKGAALDAKTNHGAINGKGWGLQGDSFAIPTKDTQSNPLPLKSIKVFAIDFKTFAASHPELEFDLSGIDIEYRNLFDDKPNSDVHKD